MKIRPAISPQSDRLTRCLEALRNVRDWAIEVDCSKLMAKIRSAIKSAGGAERHLAHRLKRTNRDGSTRHFEEAPR